MTLFEMFMFVTIISAGHFAGEVLEARMGIKGWFAGCILGIVLSVNIFAVVTRLARRLSKKKEPPALGRG